ncbi:MAG: type II secretion system protein GspD [Armatimonadetes bacterium]|nr:type II secretion system protein GspD [Armatimonadota bacterium]
MRLQAALCGAALGLPGAPIAVTHAAPGAPPAVGAKVGNQRLISLDFVDASVQDVLTALSIQIGADIIVTPGVTGKVTIRMRNRAPEEALEYVVRSTGLAYGRDGNMYLVCPRDQTATFFPAGSRGRVVFPPSGEPGEQAALSVTASATPPEMRTVRTTRVPAAEVVGLVQKLAPGLRVEAVEKHVLVLFGAAEQVQLAQEGIRALEAAVPALAPPPSSAPPPGTAARPPKLALQMYTLKWVSAVEAGRIVEGLMKARILPPVVITPAPTPVLPSVKGAPPSGARHQPAADPAAALLNLVLGGQPPAAPAAGPAADAGQAGAADPDAAVRTAMAALAPSVPRSGPGQSLPPGEGSTIAIPEGSTTRTLVLIGQPENIPPVREYLEQLDVPPPQVMIDLKVADVSLNDLTRLGVTWNWSTFGIHEVAPVGGTTSVAPGMELGRFGHVPVSLNATLEALVSSDQAQLLANPRIAVLDGNTASIHVGDTIRYLESRVAGINGTTVQIGSADVGVVLSVTPRIGGDSAITLDIRPQVNVITGFTATGDGGQVPNTSERSVETVVRLRDGETLAIGGLIRDEDIVTMQKVPALGDLPLIGELFRFRSKRRGSSEVLIFITPTILSSAA